MRELPEIGNMDEGIVKAGKNPGNSENQFTYAMISTSCKVLGEQPNICRGAFEIGLPSRTWGPREIFSCAGRSTFFFGAISLFDCEKGQSLVLGKGS